MRIAAPPPLPPTAPACAARVLPLPHPLTRCCSEGIVAPSSLAIAYVDNAATLDAICGKARCSIAGPTSRTACYGSRLLTPLLPLLPSSPSRAPSLQHIRHSRRRVQHPERLRRKHRPRHRAARFAPRCRSALEQGQAADQRQQDRKRQVQRLSLCGRRACMRGDACDSMVTPCVRCNIPPSLGWTRTATLSATTSVSAGPLQSQCLNRLSCFLPQLVD